MIWKKCWVEGGEGEGEGGEEGKREGDVMMGRERDGEDRMKDEG